MSSLDTLFARFGWLEVLARRIAYALPQDKREKAKATSKKSREKFEPTISKEELFEDVRNYGIQKGDLLIVHSSMDALAHQSANAKEILDFLLDLVGDEGTLVLPAYPNIEFVADQGQPDGQIPLYDPRRTLCWTGMLPNLFLRYPGVIRSSFPYNPLAAKGPLASAMMEHNLEGDLPHGECSAWKFCVEHDAKILFLGAKAHHSNTVVHVAEEVLDDEWPINNWYRQSVCKVKTPEEVIRFSFRERRLFWVRFMQEHYETQQFEDLGLLERHSLENVIPMGFIESSEAFVKYLIDEARQGRTSVYRIPSKYYHK